MSGKVMPKLVSSDTFKDSPLTEEQVKFYWDNGYLVINKLFDLPLLNRFKDRFVEIANMPNASLHYSIVKDPLLYAENIEPEMYINKIQELLNDPLYCQYSEAPALLRMVSQLVGSPDLTAVNFMLINKPPKTDQHLPHQDLYYIPIRPADKIIGSWTAVDSATTNNGCLYVVPGSHKVDSLYVHGETSKDKKLFFHGIVRADVAAPLEKRVQLVMNPGDTVFLHPLLVHGSGVNNSQHCRKAMTAHFASSSAHYIDVRGTVQENIGALMEAELRKRGGDLTFVDVWRVKGKQVKGVRSNL